MRKLAGMAVLGLSAVLGLVAGEREARACGGCFVPPAESTVVSDHRMVFSISQQETILWDQIQYDGDPREFAWVLPVREGTRIEISRDEWISALDASSRPTIQGPPSGFGSFDQGCSLGCSSSAEALSASAGPGEPPVQVVSQKVVGPYETVILRSKDADALQKWLRDHDFAIPQAIEPVIGQYVEERFDFVALRLQPGQGVRSMKPVRIVTPGADATLPLRMVAAGIGANVGITLFVISEGRYRPQNFPEAVLDDEKLVWDSAAGRSNYQELSQEIMGDGKTWLTEYAGKPNISGGSLQPSAGAGTATSLHGAYYGACYGKYRDAPATPDEDAGDEDAGEHDAGADAGDLDAGDLDAGDLDAGATDAGEEDASANGGTPDAGVSEGEPTAIRPPYCSSESDLCCEFDDLEVATRGLHRGDIWLTRLRANLSVQALATDLRLAAHPTQEEVSNFHFAKAPPAATTAAIAASHRTRAGSAATIIGAAFFVGRMLRRRKRA